MRHRMGWVVGVVLGVTTVCGPGPCGGRPAVAAPEDAVEAARSAAVTRLETLATWCDAQRLFGARDRVFERILVLAPNHARARSGLKFTRDRGGSWVRRDPYTPPPNWNKGLVAKADERLAAALVGYRDAVLAAADADGVPPAQRDEAVDALVDLLPDDATLRERRGDVRDEGGDWVLPETVEARKRREDLRHLARVTRRSLPTLGEAVERDGGWPTNLAAEGLSVRSTLALDVGYDLLTNALVGRAVARSVLGIPSDAKPAVTRLIAVGSREEGLETIRLNVKDPTTKLAEAQHVSGVWLSPGVVVAWETDAVVRRQGFARDAINGEIHTKFAGAFGGFVSEGIGQRLLFLATGDHGPAFVRVVGTDLPGTPDEEPLPPDARAWLPRAARLLETDGGRKVGAVLTARLNAMTPGNVLVGYALAAYLMEGRPEAFEAFVRALSTTTDAAKVVEETLAGDLGSLARRVRRFCLENA